MPKSGLMEAIKSVRYAPAVSNWAEIGAAAWRGAEVTTLRLRNVLVIESAIRSVRSLIAAIPR